jgi:hypothetical protein
MIHVVNGGCTIGVEGAKENSSSEESRRLAIAWLFIPVELRFESGVVDFLSSGHLRSNQLQNSDLVQADSQCFRRCEERKPRENRENQVQFRCVASAFHPHATRADSPNIIAQLPASCARLRFVARIESSNDLILTCPHRLGIGCCSYNPNLHGTRSTPIGITHRIRNVE